MSTWMPPINPQLLQAALARNGGVSPAPAIPAAALPSAATMAMPAAGAPAPVPMPSIPRQPVQAMGANRTTVSPYAPQPTDVPPLPQPTMAQATRPAPPSDDPAQNPWAKATQDAQHGLDTENQNVQTLMGQQPKAPNYEDYKPPLWKKIAAPFIGALAAQGHGGAEGASNAVNGMLYGRWNRAQQGYDTQEKAWEQKLGAEERTGVPLAKARAEVAHQGFNEWLGQQKEAETEKKDTANEDLRGQLNDIRDSYNNNRISQEQENRLAKIASQSDNLDLRRQALALQGQLNTAKENELNAQANKASTAGGDQNGMTASEQREFNAQTRRYNGEIDSLNRERANYVGMPDGDFKTKALKNIDDRLDQLHGKIDDAEKGIMSKRKGAAATSTAGPATPGKGFQVPKGAPAPSKPNQQLKVDGKVVATSVDGKSWGPPNGR